MYKVGIFVHELRHQNESRLDASATRSCETVLQVLEECSVQVLPPPEVSCADAEAWWRRYSCVYTCIKLQCIS